MTNHATEQIIALLAQGISTGQVAAAVGVSDAYISQLKADPAVAEQIAAAKAESTVQDIAFDRKLERAEELALDKIERGLQFANIGQALGAFKILNAARKRTTGDAVPQTNVAVTVNLTLPESVAPKYVVNNQSEIVEVEGRTMISATPKSLDSILAARAAQKAPVGLPAVTDLEKAANRLEVLRPPQRRAARQLPAALHADLL